VPLAFKPGLGASSPGWIDSTPWYCSVWPSDACKTTYAQALEHADLLSSGLPPPPAGAAPLPPEGALTIGGTSIPVPLDPGTTDPAGLSQQNAQTFFAGSAFTNLIAGGSDSNPAGSSNTLMWVLAAVAGVLFLGNVIRR
jgi:hypothetical protein